MDDTETSSHGAGRICRKSEDFRPFRTIVLLEGDAEGCGPIFMKVPLLSMVPQFTTFDIWSPSTVCTPNWPQDNISIDFVVG